MFLFICSTLETYLQKMKKLKIDIDNLQLLTSHSYEEEGPVSYFLEETFLYKSDDGKFFKKTHTIRSQGNRKSERNKIVQLTQEEIAKENVQRNFDKEQCL